MSNAPKRGAVVSLLTLAPTPPCEKFGRCAYFQACQERELSCWAFDTYLSYGAVIQRPADDVPTRDLFNKQFHTDPLDDQRTAEAKAAKRRAEGAEV